MAYIAAGDPSLDRTIDLALAIEDAGADILELGLPFSDPLADGIVNQLAAQRALQAGSTTPRVLETVARLRERSQIPLVLYTYLNPVYRYGMQKFHEDAAEAGFDGVLVLDLPPEEQEIDATLSASHRLKSIRLIAPTTPAARMVRIVKTGSGFIYYVSREGVTGERSELAAGLEERVAEIRAATDLPVAVGFGIGTPDQAAAAARTADAVVVGSAIVRRIGEVGDSPGLAGAIRDLVAPMAQAARKPN